MGKLLESINSPEDIKKLDYSQLQELAGEIRLFLIENISKTGGHLASNLGVVELTLALHKVFSTPQDKIVWDVGHQSYVHKIITGRKEQFSSIRQRGGLSGFPKTKESPHDAFNTGHSSTSISAALGLARARDIKKEKHAVVAVIGDGALTGGMAFEALNDAGRSPNNLIVILNDNEMSITKNVGGLSSYLSKMRTQPFYSKAREDLDQILNKIPAIGKPAAKALNLAKGTIKYIVMPGVIFEELGFKYLGPIDGHNINELTKVLSRAKLMKGPVLLHVCTNKGKGYIHAEEMPDRFHGISPFEIETGEVKVSGGPTYSDVFGEGLVKLAEKNKDLVAITAAMPHGTGLDPFSKVFPERFFDVGIAEQHAVTLAAGLAQAGLVPVVAIYSSFLQRAYDQIIHDVALQNLHVVFAIDRAGVVGEDGETHQGVYDLSFLGHIPNMIVASPCDYDEFMQMMEYAVTEHRGPIAVRYPRGSGAQRLAEPISVRLGKGSLLRQGNDLSIVALGHMVETALKVERILHKDGISCDVINARFAKPLDTDLICKSALKTGKVFTIEDNSEKGGMGSSILQMLNAHGVNAKVKILGFPDIPIQHGSRKELFAMYGMDVDAIVEDIKKFIKYTANGGTSWKRKDWM